MQSGGTYVNIYTLLLSSTSFSDNIGFWGRYKIVGINARASAGSSIATLDSAFVNCAPTLSIAFYPQLTSTALGSNPAYNDQKFT